LAKRHNYKVWIGSWHTDIKAEDATGAKRSAAHIYRNRNQYWDKTIESIMKRATAKRY